MKNQKFALPATTARLLLASALGLGALAAHAATGVTVQPKDEAKIQVGMSQDEVRAALGRPAEAQHFKLSNSSTWSYRVPSAEATQFQVDFDAQGRVSSAGQFMETQGG